MNKGELKMKDERWITGHYGEDHEEYLNAVNPPVYMSSLHFFDNISQYYQVETRKPGQFFYGRVDNPTTLIAEKKAAALENGTYGMAFASGMAAATTAIMAVLKCRSHIVCVKNAYSVLTSFIDTYLVPKMEMSVTYVDGSRTEDVLKAITDKTDLIILESPVSLIFSVQDIRAITKVAKEKGITTYIDNSYCTPLFQKPLEMGVDIVMHTASKYLGGHSDIIAGLIVTNNEALYKSIHTLREQMGGILDPQAAYLMIRGMRTLSIRVEAHAKTALSVAEFLEGHPLVSKVYYPGLKSHPQYELIQSQQSGSTGLMAFELKTQKTEKIVSFVDHLTLFKIGVSWGGFESLVCTPMLMKTEEEAQSCGCGRGIIRIHCGLEGSELLIEDLKQALEKMEETE